MSKVAISNRALTFLGANRIVSLSDDTLEAKAISNMYDESLKSILAECDWKFATKRVVLNKLDKQPIWQENGMRNYFQIPSDCIEIFDIMNKNAIWTREGNEILSNTDEFAIKYVYFCTDTNLYPPFFIDAFATRIACDICYEITNSTEKAATFLELYKGEYLPIAKTKNARQASRPHVEDGLWVNSIYRGIEG